MYPSGIVGHWVRSGATVKFFYAALMFSALLFVGCQSDEPKPLKTVVDIDGLKTVSDVTISGKEDGPNYAKAYIAEDKTRQKYIVISAFNTFYSGCGKMYFQDSGIISKDVLNVDMIWDFPPVSTRCTTVLRHESTRYPTPYSSEYQKILIHHYKKDNVDPNKKHNITRLKMPKLFK
jgi:hypothetical protein